MAETGQTGAEGAAEKPKTDFTLTENDAPVTAKEPPKEDKAPETDKKSEKEPETEKDQQTDSSEGEKKRPTGYQRKLAKKDAEISRLNAELQSLKQPAPKKPEAEATPKPKLEDFATFEDYNSALVSHEADAKVKKALDEQKTNSDTEAAKAQAYKELQDKGARWEKGKEELRKTTPDFDQLVENYDGPESPQILMAILDSEKSAEVQLFLMKNPEEADKMEGMNTLQLSKFIGRIEAKLETQVSEKEKKSEKQAAVTKAPPPVSTVKGNAVSPSLASFDHENGSFDDFYALRQAEKRQKR